MKFFKTQYLIPKLDELVVLEDYVRNNLTREIFVGKVQIKNYDLHGS
jgi:hypothetical protein